MPYRIDLFAVFIFLGIVQALFLTFFFFSKENRVNKANVFHGWMLVAIAACLLEIFLMYSGYIVHCFYMVDFSEAFALLIGPCFYLLVISLTQGEPRRKDYVHFIFPVIYFFVHLPYLLLPEDAKYNAWVGDYHPELPYRDYDMPYRRWAFLTDHHTELVLFSLAFYGLLGTLAVIKTFRQRKESIWTTQHPVLGTLRAGAIQLISSVIILLVIKLLYENDLGDHIFAAYIAVTIYITSFSVIKNSGFFRQAPLTEQQKYKTSSLTAEQQQVLLEKLRQVLETDRPYLNPDFSLPELAEKMKVTVHTLSQVINDGMGKTFFEMVAGYRIEVAKKLLKDQPNIKVEEIAAQVGYHSKSSFNTSFKKITGKTPSEFRGS